MKVVERVRVGRRAIRVPSVPSMADLDRPAEANGPADGPDQLPPVDRSPIDRRMVQYLDRVRAIFRPARSDALAPSLKHFVGREDVFRHVGTADTGSDGAQPMMQCPSYWPDCVRWVPIRDLEILENLEDQDVRAG